jgi:septum formation protein
LLAEAGIEIRVRPPELDDGTMQPGEISAEAWVMSLAFLKARQVAIALRREGHSSGLVLGADTICVCEGEFLGQPRDADHARAMIGKLQGGVHDTITGVCLIDLATGRRSLWADTAIVHVGPLAPEQVESYIASGAWRGKAGAYNLSERIAEGWPISVDGDPTTVMGLPMRRLTRALGLIGGR